MRTAVLQDFRIPCAEFDSTGRLERLSNSAEELLATEVPSFTRQAGQLVVELISRSCRAHQTHDLPSLEAPSTIPGLKLLTRLLPGSGDRRIAVVVLLPMRSSVTGSASNSWGLSPREQSVAELINSGSSTKEIAERLCISTHTVRRHTERVFAKLGVQSRGQLMALMRVPGGVPATSAVRVGSDT